VAPKCSGVRAREECHDDATRTHGHTLAGVPCMQHGKRKSSGVRMHVGGCTRPACGVLLQQDRDRT
jgi:hypothetical protein